MMKMTNKTYDILKLIAIIILPLSELIGSLSGIWGLPHGQEIVATLAAIHIFLGAILKHSSDVYAVMQDEHKE